MAELFISQKIKHLNHDTNPYQRAITAFKNIGDTTVGRGEILIMLESLLPKEKEFVQKIWEAAEACAADGENPDKFEFLNQLYPKS